MRAVRAKEGVEIAPSILAADFARLGEQIAELKAKYDPNNLFRFNQNIQPAS